jgi:cytochrome b561
MPVVRDATPATVYDTPTIAFHWLTVLLVAAQWLGAHTIDWFPRGVWRTDVRSLHILLGTALAVLILSRMAWRCYGGRKLPPADKGPLHRAATLVHSLLYVLLAAIVGLGLLNAWARGDSLFGLFSLPKLIVSAGFKERVSDLHGLSANAVLLVAGGHAAASLWHQYAQHDGVLGRMIPLLHSGKKR